MQFKYNVLSGLLIALSGCILGLLYVNFGPGDDLAAFFLIITSITVMQMFVALPFQQFIFLQNRITTADPDRSGLHYSFCLLFSIFISGLIGLVVINSQYFFIGLLLPNLENSLMGVGKELFEIALLNIFVGAPMMIAQQKVNSLGKILYSYFISFIPILFQLGTLIYIYFNHVGIIFVVWSLVLGNLCAFALAMFFTRKTFRYLDPSCIAFIKPLFQESFKVKFAHNIHNFALLYFINSIASGLPTNFSSLLFGVKRLADSLQQVIVGPLLRILPTYVAKLIKSNQQLDVINETNRLSKVNTIFFASMLSVLLLGLLVFETKIPLDAEEIEFVVLCMVGFLSFSLITCLETPYAVISMVFGKSKSFYVSNTLFSMVMFCAYISLDSSGSYAPIFYGLVFGQTFVLMVNRHFAKYYLQNLKL